jgi:hypothetical protein
LSGAGSTIRGIAFENIGDADGKTAKSRKSAAHEEDNVRLSRRRLSCNRNQVAFRALSAERPSVAAFALEDAQPSMLDPESADLASEAMPPLIAPKAGVRKASSCVLVSRRYRSPCVDRILFECCLIARKAQLPQPPTNVHGRALARIHLHFSDKTCPANADQGRPGIVTTGTFLVKRPRWRRHWRRDWRQDLP